MWDLPGPGTEPESHAWQADSLPLRYQGSPGCMYLFELWLSLGICLGVGHMIVLLSVFLRNLLHTVLWDSQVALGGEDPIEFEMATHSSILSWKIPWTEEPGSLQSMGSQTVGHD